MLPRFFSAGSALWVIRSMFRTLFRKPELDRDLDDELRSFLDQLTDEKIRAGMEPEQARRQARIELGGVEQVKERVRQRRLGAPLDTVTQDVRNALRGLRKDKTFAVVAIVTLALGIGATTALFSTVYTALLRRLPYDQPDRLVMARKTIAGRQSLWVSFPDYLDYREQCRCFENLAALADSAGTLTGGPTPQLVQTAHVTWNFLPTLGVNPVAGRHFQAEEEARGDAAVAIISHALWQSRFGGSPDAVGSTFDLDGSPLTTIGVMPRGFRFLRDYDLWRVAQRPVSFDLQRDAHSHVAVGRLAPGFTLEQAQSEVDAIAAGLRERYPETNEDKGLRLTGLHEFLVEGVRTSLLMLMATTVLVLLIACGNVAGLLLARGHRRLPEMALRSALGASRLRLVRQLLSESLLLSALAGVAGIGIAYLLQDLILRLLPMGRLGIHGPAIDSGVLLFALATSLATGLIVGGLPALRGTAVDLAPQIGTGCHSSCGVPGTRLRSALVALQVAVAVVLLIGTGLLVRSLGHLAEVELGFDPQNLLTGQTQLQADKYPDAEQRNRFFSSVLEEIEALPGVVSASMINNLPILNPSTDWAIWPADRPPPAAQENYFALARFVPPGYFGTLRIPLLKGRDISATDAAEAPRVVVVSETVARDFFPDRDPLGGEVRIGWESDLYKIVGVVADARLSGLRSENHRAMYMPYAQCPYAANLMRLAVRTRSDPTALVAPIRHILRQKDRDVLFSSPATMDSIIDDELAGFRIITFSLSLFSAVAILLTGIGLYGVLAYHLSQRQREIGIRVAIGATHKDLVAAVTRRGLGVVGIGLLLGLAAAYPGTLLIRQLLFGIPPLDAATYGNAFLFLTAVSLLACLLPARRALRINPVEVLKTE